MSKLNKQWVYIIPLVFIYCMISNFTVTDVHSEEPYPGAGWGWSEFSCLEGMVLCDPRYPKCCQAGKCCGVADGGGFNVIKAFAYEDCNCTKKDSWTDPQEDADICCAYCLKVQEALCSIPYGQVRGTIDDYSNRIYCKILGYTDSTEPYFCCSDDEICSYNETECVGVTIVNDKVNFEVYDTELIKYSYRKREYWNGHSVVVAGTYFIRAKLWAKNINHYIHTPIKVIVNKLEYVEPRYKSRLIKLDSATETEEGVGTKGSKQAIYMYPPQFLERSEHNAVHVEFAIDLLWLMPFEFFVDVEAIDIGDGPQ